MPPIYNRPVYKLRLECGHLKVVSSYSYEAIKNPSKLWFRILSCAECRELKKVAKSEILGLE